MDQLTKLGRFVTAEIAGEPIVVVCGSDNLLRGFFNVCRHHAAAVMTEPEGSAPQLRCPYHGWTYSLEGELKGTPDFTEVCNFDRANNGLIRIAIATWEKWVFAKLDRLQRPPPSKSENGLDHFLGIALIDQFRNLNLTNLHWLERRRYTLNC